MARCTSPRQGVARRARQLSRDRWGPHRAWYHAAVASDRELLEAWRQGHAGSGDTLVRKHFGAVYRFFRNKVSGDLDDLVQDTFMTCAAARANIRDDGSFRPYLFAVARNVLKAHYARVHKQRENFDPLESSVADLGLTPTQQIAGRQEHRLLLNALRSITLDDQVALELVYWERLTGKEVGLVLGIPEGTARSRLRAARQSLEAKVAELGRSSELVVSTLDNLERWSESVREYLGSDAQPL